jgi:hypothetical protein
VILDDIAGDKEKLSPAINFNYFSNLMNGDIISTGERKNLTVVRK